MNIKLFVHSVKDAWLVLLTLVLLSLPALSIINQWWFILFIHGVLLLNAQNTSMHHHAHWNTFCYKVLNNLYEILLSMASAVSAQFYKLGHLTHHKHVNDVPTQGYTKDPISVFQNGIAGQRENMWRFCFRKAWYAMTYAYRGVSSMIGLARPMDLTHMRVTAWKQQQCAVVLWQLTLLLIDPWYGVCYWFMCFAATFCNYAWHYGEHQGAHHMRGDTTRDAVGIYSWWYNTFCFNSGYHQEHHHKPGVHWTKLPTVTAALPADRCIRQGTHVGNAPWWQDLRGLFRSSSS